MTAISIRHLLPSDSLEALTDMLRQAFAPLGERGLNCTCVDQTVETTRHRVSLGDCFVAVARGQIVGTVTLQPSDGNVAIRWYRHPAVASLHQLGVAPSYQCAGIGSALLRTAECWASERRYRGLALDTPEPAQHLRDFYGRHGFRAKETLQIDGRAYRSVVLSKPIGQPRRRPTLDAWPARHPAEMAILAKHAHSHGRQGSNPGGPSVCPAAPASVARSDSPRWVDRYSASSR